MYKCRLCGIEKDVLEFTQNKNCKNGHEKVCKACSYQRQFRWRQENKERYREKQRDHYLRNKEAYDSQAKKYAREHKEWKNSRTAYRRARKFQATPKWADQEKIAAIYKKAAELRLSVDHIIPLNSPVVCGLHVETNLQLLPIRENISKSNKFDPMTYVHVY